MQSLFAESEQEVEFAFIHLDVQDRVTKRRRIADGCVDSTVVEFQHSRITKKEVDARNDDYVGKLGKTVAWVIDCTNNASMPRKVSPEKDAEEVWMLEFDTKWHVEAMRDCRILFAVFREKHAEERIFRVPIESVCHRLVLVYGSWTDMLAWKRHVVSGDMEADLIVPIQSTLTVAQDPHGSGKTYALTRMMLDTDTDENARFDAYSTFIVVTKPHSAKEVVYSEFMLHLLSAGFEHSTTTSCNKYVVKFTRPSGSKIMCIFGTVDSLMFNLCENKMHGADVFLNLVKTIHTHGPTKLHGPKGHFNYAGEQPCASKRTLLITDEATMLPESYAGAFATLMAQCHVDVHLAGDVQQSTLYEDNLLTRVMREQGDASDASEQLPSFPGCRVLVQQGNKVRRFNQKLVDFRNTVMRDFHEKRSDKLHILAPVAAQDVTHSRGEHFVHQIEETAPWTNVDSEEVVQTVEIIMERLKGDVRESKLLPSDILIVTPFVKNNPLMDELQTNIHEFWGRTFYEPAYECRLREKGEDEADQGVEARMRKYGEALKHFEAPFELPWFCVLHRSEEGRPIDTNESKHCTRIVSIHASQGDGRKFVYVVGLAEKKLKRFSAGKKNLKYESLLNVAVSRMKEVIRVFIEPTYDDVWERFLPFMDEEQRRAVPPCLRAKTSFDLSRACDLDIDEGLFDTVKQHIVAATSADGADSNRPVVDHAHHVIRMATAHTVFWAHLVTQQANKSEFKEQVHTVFRTVAKRRIKSLPSTTYYKELRNCESDVLPVLDYDSGAASFKEQHERTLFLLSDVQKHVQRWLDGEEPDFRALTPEHTVLLQYAVDVVKLAPYGKHRIKMDHVYDVVHCSMKTTDECRTKLDLHYATLDRMHSMFEQVKTHAKAKEWSWKIHRSLRLGNRLTGNLTQHFGLKMQIEHLFVTPSRAMPIILVEKVDDISMGDVCKKALLYTLVCMQPEKAAGENFWGRPTWQYLHGRTIEICLVPIKGSRPVFVNLMQVVEENIAVLATWICAFTRRETELDVAQAMKIAEHFRNDFEDAQDLVCAAHKCRRCPDYMRDAFNEAQSADEVSLLLENKLKVHLNVLQRDIKSRRV